MGCGASVGGGGADSTKKVKIEVTFTQVMENEVFRESFHAFLRLKNCGILMDFWLQSESYTKEPDSERAFEGMAMLAKYFSDGDNGGKSKLEVSPEVLASIRSRLSEAPLDLFDQARMEVRDRMNLVWFNPFLSSPHFAAVSPNKGGGVQIRDILGDPLSQGLFYTYLNSIPQRQSTELDMLHFWDEIHDYQDSTNDENYRRKRAKKIYMQFLDAEAVCMVNLGQDVADSITNNLNQAPADLFSAAEAEVEEYFASNHLVKFTQSEFFRGVLDQRRPSVTAVTGDAAVIAAAASTLDFDVFLQDPVAAAYFRRFMRKEFSEENFLFYNEVNQFKAQNFENPNFGTAYNFGDTMDKDEQMRFRAGRIIDKFVNSGSRFQVNVSAAQRDKVVQEYQTTGANINMFASLESTCLSMMKRDTFARYKEDPLFSAFAAAYALRGATETRNPAPAAEAGAAEQPV